MPLIHSECLTLRRRRTRDADALVTLFCRQHGKIIASAPGVLKTAGRYAGVTQPFTQLHAVLYAKTEDQEIWTLTQAGLIRQYKLLQTDLTRMAYASCLAEWIDLLSGEFESNTLVWDLLVKAFNRWEEQSPKLEELIYCQWQLLIDAGVQPEIRRCCRCDREESPAWLYQPQQGGIVCSACKDKGIPLSGGAIQALRKLIYSFQYPPVRLSNPQKNEINLLLKTHLEHYMEVQSKAELFLDKILKNQFAS